ncbi:DNA-3-methyladenine glycosylase [Paenibacillus swuensis]|uniref:DNA-3-methyladenine glycosylase II n=1 Tax=Paenibacillus swuensis TaxID=1178515 RepID=A0A172TKU8_9BACL|nr:DNA-3-methyladenine glycosylase [Paenibacillus swuensis]ANE47689.1 DNA-3-methyladenine glycosylase [Paenibacillus swuensis]
MNWTDYTNYVELVPPADFDLKECLVFLGRSEQEILHRVDGSYLYKLIQVDSEKLLLRLGATTEGLLRIELPHGSTTAIQRNYAADYIWNMLDLGRNLKPFYMMAEHDPILCTLISKYYGLRLIGIPDLFEALTWAITGQQILLSFAYTLKKRLVETYGESIRHEGKEYWLYSSCERIAALETADLKALQFTNQKADYIIGIARAMASGDLDKDKLLRMQDSVEMRNALLNLRGIGAWTADYVLMKCLKVMSAIPMADVGLHNALKLQLGWERKPTLEEIATFKKGWTDWEAYATFYLWRSLYK